MAPFEIDVKRAILSRTPPRAVSMLERRLRASTAVNGQVNEARRPLLAVPSRERHASSVQHIARVLPPTPWCLVQPALARLLQYPQSCAGGLHERRA